MIVYLLNDLVIFCTFSTCLCSLHIIAQSHNNGVGNKLKTDPHMPFCEHTFLLYCHQGSLGERSAVIGIDRLRSLLKGI